jgi:DNA-binding transcriptional MerR regulator
MLKLIRDLLRFEQERETDFSDKMECERIAKFIVWQLKATRRREMANISIMMAPYIKLSHIMSSFNERQIKVNKKIIELEDSGFKRNIERADKKIDKLFQECREYIENYNEHTDPDFANKEKRLETWYLKLITEMVPLKEAHLKHHISSDDYKEFESWKQIQLEKKKEKSKEGK